MPQKIKILKKKKNRLFISYNTFIKNLQLYIVKELLNLKKGDVILHLTLLANKFSQRVNKK